MFVYLILECKGEPLCQDQRSFEKTAINISFPLDSTKFRQRTQYERSRHPFVFGFYTLFSQVLFSQNNIASFDLMTSSLPTNMIIPTRATITNPNEIPPNTTFLSTAISIYPFEFSYFANVLPDFLRFLMQWISNEIALVILIILFIIHLIFAVYSLIIRLYVRKARIRS